MSRVKVSAEEMALDKQRMKLCMPVKHVSKPNPEPSWTEARATILNDDARKAFDHYWTKLREKVLEEHEGSHICCDASGNFNIFKTRLDAFDFIFKSKKPAYYARIGSEFEWRKDEEK